MEFLTSLLAVIVAISCISLGECTILDKLRDDPDLSQFYTLLERNPIANATLQLRSVTVFVPTNEAFQKFDGNTSVLYHISTVAFTKDQLPKTVLSDLDGNPPLYITRNRNGDIFVNNALIVPSRSMQMVNQYGYKQVMHVIEDVLVPLTIVPSLKAEIPNPDAFQFLNQAESMNIGKYRLRSYRSQVTIMKKESLYQSPGGHTFLIPIDEGFKLTTRSSLVDQKVIDGHVIPNNVLFTSAAPIEVPQTTAAFEDNIKVTVSFFQQKDGKMYAKSNTIVGDAKHATGVVLAEIVKGNIPVRNGVVHLIHRPLMIVDTTVTQFLQSFKILSDNQNGALRKFYEVIMDMGGEVLDDISKLGNITILAPSNEAWNQSNVQNILKDRQKMREILNMHIIKDRLNVDKIRSKNAHSISQVGTVNNKTFLYFNVNSDGNGNETISVEGGGVNATFLQADVAQTNGYVHIIDRVLGIPYTTVLGKLRTDPMLNATYLLGKLSRFNDQLNISGRRYTFFVPRDKAWMKTAIDSPSAHKKLFMIDFSYHTRSVLERHLVLADQVYTMDDLVAMSEDAKFVTLSTVRDNLKIRVTEEYGPPPPNGEEIPENEMRSGYVIHWNFKKIKVYRPDVECTNGIIHVIDRPLMEEKDIVVNRAAFTTSINSIQTFVGFTTAANLLLISFNKFLL